MNVNLKNLHQTETPASILRLILTPECNLRCIYCHNEGFSRENDVFPLLPPEEFEKIFLSLKQNGVKSVCLTGGDPLLSESFRDVLKAVTNVFGGKTTHVSTNGILLDQYLDLMKNVGVSRINVSCDAVESETYEKITGKNCFETVVKNIEKAVDYNFFVNVNCVTLKGLNTDSDYIRSMLDFWRKKNVRLSFLRLCFASNETCSHRYDINELIRMFDTMDLKSHLTRHENRPPTLCYKYKDMDIALRYYVPDRSSDPCKECEKRNLCSEGLYHPRLGLNGTLRSCILRDDLSLNLRSEKALNNPLTRFLQMFDAVSDTWVPADLDAP